MSRSDYIILCTTAATLLLTGCSAPADGSAGWWSSSEIPPAPRSSTYRKWSERRAVVPDTTLHRLVRNLLAQRNPDLGMPETPTRFWLGQRFFDRKPVTMPAPVAAGLICRKCNDPSISRGLLRNLVVEHKLLVAADTVFIHQQLTTSSTFRLQAQQLPGCAIIPVDTLQAIEQQVARKKQPPGYALVALANRYNIRPFTDVVCYVSTPLFSQDLQTVIIEISYVTLSKYGMDGAGNTLVLHRENKRWKIMLKDSNWIS